MSKAGARPPVVPENVRVEVSPLDALLAARFRGSDALPLRAIDCVSE
jgi:hypothetical protein